MDAAGEVVRLSTGSPALVAGDPSRIEWVLNGAQWQELLAPGPSGATAHSLSIAVTSDLRAAAWADVPVLPAPDWAVRTQSITSSAERPLEVEESVVSLTSWLGGIATNAASERRIFEVVPSASGSSGASGTVADALLVSALHSAPFEEVLTGHAYFRARWLHYEAATFLSSDPLGYGASGSSLDSFCAQDPINRRDPDGMQVRSDFITNPEDRRAILKRDAQIRSEICGERPEEAVCQSYLRQFLAAVFGDQRADILRSEGDRDDPGAIIFVNGIDTEIFRARGYADLIQRDLEMPVTLVYNPTVNKPCDLLQCAFMNKLGGVDELVRLLVTSIRSALRVRPKILIVAHSQGGMIASDALRLIKRSERSRIHLVTFGAASWAYPNDLASEYHVVNVLDLIVPMPSGKGARALTPSLFIFDRSQVDYTIFYDKDHGAHGFPAYWARYFYWRDADTRDARAKNLSEAQRRRMDWIERNHMKR